MSPVKAHASICRHCAALKWGLGWIPSTRALVDSTSYALWKEKPGTGGSDVEWTHVALCVIQGVCMCVRMCECVCVFTVCMH